MAALITSDFVLPTEVANGIWKKAQSESTIARLSGAEPQKFGQTNVMVLTAAPKAELVGESAQKSPTPTTYGNKTVNPLKLQVTMRVSNEVQWADEDYQLGILNDMIGNAGVALGRALDLVGYHKINPLTGAVSAAVTEGVTDTTNSATLANGKYDQAVEAAAGLIIADGYTPNGIAMDPTLSFGLGTQRNADDIKLYPEIGFGTDVSAFLGMKAAVSDTVSGKQEIPSASATNIIGIVGQFDAIRWGIQRDIRAHLIEFGDPDGLGDLQRLNQVAIRAEIVYGIGIMDLNAFAKVVTA
jgi:HK97 family phage major capsid protein